MPLTAEQNRERRAREAAYADLAGIVSFRPLDKPVNGAAERSPFKADWPKTVRLLKRELEMLRAEHVMCLVDMREQDFRVADGLPRADRSARTPGVVMTFETRMGSHRYEGVKFDRWQDNIRAIALGLEALRMVDRYGITKSGEQYRGWLALPMGSGASVSRGVELVEQHGSVNKALKATHPDTSAEGSKSRQDYESVMAAKAAGVVK